MDLPNGRGDAPTANGGVTAEETETAAVRRKKAQAQQLVREAIHGLLEEKRKDDDGQGEEKDSAARQRHEEEEEEGLLSSLLTKLDALEADPDSRISEEQPQPHSSHQNDQPVRGEISGKQGGNEKVELADIAKDLGKIKRQNTVTHLLLGAVIVLTAVWQVNEVSFLLWVQRKMSNPFKSLGDMVKDTLKLKGKKPVAIESSPLPPVGVPEVGRGDLPSLIIGSSEDMD
ncbi:unnamed protein product [Urochloa decumbens]|uniref:Uncharacterized protein n=1 Tax=Urochloa decumbens TaxID=240449 RepID=A0ABC9CL10_9POAL